MEEIDHKNVNDPPDLKSKGCCLMYYLLEDYQQQTSNENAILMDMLPSEHVDCFSGYDPNLEEVMENPCLCNQLADNGRNLLRDCVYDYTRHSLHTEEVGDVLHKSRVKYNPNAFNKATCLANIDYGTGLRKERDDSFVKNVTKDLWLRGYKDVNLSNDSQQRVPLLSK